MRQPHENGKLSVANYLQFGQYGSAWFLPEWRIRLPLPSYGQVEVIIGQSPPWEPPPRAPSDIGPSPADFEPSLAAVAGGTTEQVEPQPQPHYYGTADDEQADAERQPIRYFHAAEFAGSAFRGFTENRDKRLRPPCAIEDIWGCDGWVIKFVVVHPAERCHCFHGREAA